MSDDINETEQVARLIGDIYDASLDRNLWPGVLEQTCHYVGGCAAALMAQDATLDGGQFYFEWGNDPKYLKLYQDTYSRLNPLHIPTLLHAKVGSVLASTDLVPLSEIAASRFYKEWLTPPGIVDAIAATLDRSATSYAVLALHRHVSQGRVDDETRRRLGLLAPHFRRSVAVGKVIDLHKVEAAVLADTLDGIAAGTFLVSADARITYANAAGQALLDDGAVVRNAMGKLAAGDARADQALRDAFASADGGDQEMGLKGIAVPLVGSGNTQLVAQPWVAHVLPLTCGARRRASTSYAAVAAVFVRKATLDLPCPIETLANVYRLTPAEIRVLMGIVEIGGVPEVAPVLGISETTVKTHLQHVFEKTGTKRQADLVKLVAGFMSPLNR